MTDHAGDVRCQIVCAAVKRLRSQRIGEPGELPLRELARGV